MPELDPDGVTSPRKLPRQQRSAATVSVILDAAARILEQRGFDGYTTNAIAEVAGLSIGSCYQYFPSKEAVTAALIVREGEQLARDLHQAAEARTWDEGIRLAIAAAVSHQMRQPRLALLLDIAEYILHLDKSQPDIGNLAQTVIARLLALDDAPRVANTEQISADIVAIAHGLIDGAGKRGETDCASLNTRVQQAVSGYLTAVGQYRGR